MTRTNAISLLLTMCTAAHASDTSFAHAKPVIGKPTQALVAKIRAEMGSTLRDPYSAVLDDLYTLRRPGSPSDVTVCGTVNAKNGFGAYEGKRMFIYIDDGTRTMVSLQGEPFWNAAGSTFCALKN